MADFITRDAIISRQMADRLERVEGNLLPPVVALPVFQNLVTNGGFDADADWVKGTGWTISGGAAIGSSGDSSSLLSPYNKDVKSGLYCRLTSDVVASVTGNLFASINAGASTNWGASSGAKALSAYAGSTTSHGINLFMNATFAGSVDNVSLWEADPSDDVPWLRLPAGWVFDKRCKISRDGLELYPDDYTLVERPGQTFIKPLAAPGVNTRFQVFACEGY